MRWRGLSKEIGRDVEKFHEVMMREIYSQDRSQTSCNRLDIDRGVS